LGDTIVTVAITGASGAVYGIKLIKVLLESEYKINLVISGAGIEILSHELGIKWRGEAETVEKEVNQYFQAKKNKIRYFSVDNLLAPLSSGSYCQNIMIICPCSMGALSRIASGHSGNLIERTADVFIKEGRKLLLVPRETPLSRIHLENMLKLSSLGATILPAMPAFYTKPEKIEDMVDFVVGKILDVLKIKHNLFKRWG
jgi:4-hydroxy-3-polyprenylbenzoate decarboxylase